MTGRGDQACGGQADEQRGGGVLIGGHRQHPRRRSHLASGHRTWRSTPVLRRTRAGQPGGESGAPKASTAPVDLDLWHTHGPGVVFDAFKSVLDDESRGVFQGKIVVRPNAQKTDARMMTRALRLSASITVRLFRPTK